jgi:hypothetical protein
MLNLNTAAPSNTQMFSAEFVPHPKSVKLPTDALALVLYWYELGDSYVSTDAAVPDDEMWDPPLRRFYKRIENYDPAKHHGKCWEPPVEFLREATHMRDYFHTKYAYRAMMDETGFALTKFQTMFAEFLAAPADVIDCNHIRLVVGIPTMYSDDMHTEKLKTTYNPVTPEICNKAYVQPSFAYSTFSYHRLDFFPLTLGLLETTTKKVGNTSITHYWFTNEDNYIFRLDIPFNNFMANKLLTHILKINGDTLPLEGILGMTMPLYGDEKFLYIQIRGYQLG